MSQSNIFILVATVVFMYMLMACAISSLCTPCMHVLIWFPTDFLLKYDTGSFAAKYGTKCTYVVSYIYHNMTQN